MKSIVPYHIVVDSQPPQAGGSWRKFFGSRQTLLTNGFFGQMFTYLLFWTFLYGMVHVY